MACFSQLGLIYFTLSLLKWRGTGRSWIIWHWHFVFWSSGILLIFFSYNKKAKKRGWWVCLHEREFRLLFPWEIFVFPLLPLLLSVIDGVIGWRGFLLAKNVLNSPHMWEQPRFPGLMLAMPHELLTGHDKLWGLDLLWGNQEVLVDRTLEKRTDGGMWRCCCWDGQGFGTHPVERLKQTQSSVRNGFMFLGLWPGHAECIPEVLYYLFNMPFPWLREVCPSGLLSLIHPLSNVAVGRKKSS